MRFLVATLFLLACMGSAVPVRGTDWPPWPLYQTHTDRLGHGLVAVWHRSRVVGRVVRPAVPGHNYHLLRDPNTHRLLMKWGWRYKATVAVYTVQGQRLTPARYENVRLDFENGRILLFNHTGQDSAQVVLSAGKHPTFYPFSRR
jgi:hypothetical protein